MSYYVGIDFGELNIGVSISDENKKIAFPLAVIKRENGSFGFRKIKKLLENKEIEAFIVGLPLKTNGTLSEQGNKILEYTEILKNYFNKDVITWDERYTTVIAENALRTIKTKRKKRKNIIDKVASQLILQSYLDYINNLKQ